MRRVSPRPLGSALALAALLLAAPAAARAADPARDPRAGAAPRVPVHPCLEPLRPWLRDEDWTVRSLAGFELRRHGEPGVVALAAAMLDRETNPYAAAGALGALRGRTHRELVMEGGARLAHALLRWARCEHPTVAAMAREVLARVPPVRLGPDLARYEGWWRVGRAALANEQRVLLEEAARRAPRAPRAKPGRSSTDREPSVDDRFYARLHSLRRDGLELCIVLDHTGSMGPVIGAAKAGAQRLVERLRSFVPRVRAGLVTYDDAPRLRCVLTQDAAALARAFAKVAAGGGGDLEEGVDKGIALALRQERLGWSRKAWRVIVVVGDAPPHEADVPGLLRRLGRARGDVLYDQPVVVHTISTDDLPVPHFQEIARAGGGEHVLLSHVGRLVDELVLLSFGGSERKRVRAWLSEIDALRAADPALRKPGRR
jgi:Mg-chelatase subunit ChlD